MLRSSDAQELNEEINLVLSNSVDEVAEAVDLETGRSRKRLQEGRESEMELAHKEELHQRDAQLQVLKEEHDRELDRLKAEKEASIVRYEKELAALERVVDDKDRCLDTEKQRRKELGMCRNNRCMYPRVRCHNFNICLLQWLCVPNNNISCMTPNTRPLIWSGAIAS